MAAILPTPIRSRSDKKDYRVIRLANGLTSLLISDMASLNGESRKEQILDDDPNLDESEESSEDDEDSDEGLELDGEMDEDPTDEMEMEDGGKSKKIKLESTQYQAAASLCIGAGGFEDPFEVPGLMHFLEHMVFMGSKKYPKENYFDAYTKKHGGDSNAHTDTENTTFHFNVQEEFFKKTLDIFAQFFISPLMMKDAMKRERDAVHSEFQLSVQDDETRGEQLFSTMAVEGHPMTKFSMGNEKTLSLNISDDDLHKKLHDLSTRYYSAQFMTLAVQARESLDTLQEWVTEIFSEVPNNGLPRPSYKDLPFPFPKERIHFLYKVIPVKEFHSLDIAWVLPSQLGKYKSKPLNYLSHLIGDEGVGSILSYLKKRDWSAGLAAGNSGGGYEDNTTCSIMSISVSLTDEGFKHLEEVLLIIFEYIKLLQKEGPLEWVFKELQSVEQLNFDYETESSPAENVEELSESMQLYPPEHYLTGDSLLFEYDEKAIEECLSAMSPDSCNIMIFSKEFENLNICDRAEEWYGTKYCFEAIPPEWIEKWRNAPLNPQLQLPKPNDFIPSDFSLLSGVEPSGEYPERILKRDFGELWFKLDRKYKLPRAFCYVLFRMECVKTSARMCALLELFLTLFQQQIQEKVYPASMAKYSCKIEPCFPGFSLKLSGFNQKLKKCLGLFLSQMDTFSSLLQDSTFDQMKMEQLKSYHNAAISPSIMRRDVRLSLLQEVHWSAAEKLKALQNVTKEEFLNEFAHHLLSRCDIRMLVQGNMTSSGAKDLFNLVSEKRGSSAPSPCSEMRTRKLKSGSWIARLSSINKADVNSSVINYYQAGVGTMWSELLNEFIIMVMDEPVFDFLRTREQLGYCVYSTNRNTYGILGISVTVDTQADKFSVDHVDKKIEEVLKMILQHLKEMSSKEFACHLETLKKMKLTVDVTLEEEVNRNWSEIQEGEYIFDRLAKHVEMVHKINQMHVTSWFEKMVSSSKNPDYRKLSVQVLGASSVNCETAPTLEDTINQPIEKLLGLLGNDAQKEKSGTKNCFFIKNLESFKGQLQFHPVTKILL